MDALDPLTIIPEAHLKLTVERYHRMIDAGVFDEDDRIELLEGVLVEMTPQSQPHARVIQRLTALLVRGVGTQFEVRVQLPLTVSDLSEPEPDFAVVPAGDFGAGKNHPSTALLVVEVARDSLKKDRLIKSALYAAANIPEYWLIDIDHAAVEVFSQPDASAGRYARRTTLKAGETLTSEAFPTLKIALSELLG